MQDAAPSRILERPSTSKGKPSAKATPITGKDLGLEPGHPFYDAPIISSYSPEQAVDDGIFLKLAPTVFCTTSAAYRLAKIEPDRADVDAIDIDINKLRRIATLLLTTYSNGTYCAPERCAVAPDEADEYLAYYMVNGDAIANPREPAPGDVRVWIAREGERLTLMLPEDY